MAREGWGREWWAVTEGRMLTVEKTKRRRYCRRSRPLLVCVAWRWGCGCACRCRLWALVTRSLVGTGRSTAVVGGVGCWWVVDVVPWVLAVVCHSLSSLCEVVDLATIEWCPPQTL